VSAATAAAPLLPADEATLIRRCPICPHLPDEIACYLRYEREILTDLQTASRVGSPDAEVLASDLAQAARHIDALIGLGRRGRS
jgi:hypothetical protein